MDINDVDQTMLNELKVLITEILYITPQSEYDFEGMFPVNRKVNINLYNKIKDLPNFSKYFKNVTDLMYMIKQYNKENPNEYLCERFCKECKHNLTKYINLNKGYRKFCGKKCSRNNSESKEHYTKTLIDKYGDPHYNNSELNKQTCLQRYGVENVFQCKSIKEKAAQTKLDKYGDANYTNKEQRFKTCQEKYGVIHPFQNPQILERVQNNFMKKYGVRTPMEVKEFKEKQKQIMKDRYGYTNTFQSPEVRNKLLALRLDNSHYSSKPEKEWLDFMFVENSKNNRQVAKFGYSFDGYVDEITGVKTVYEFLGDYYHGHPRLWYKNPNYTESLKKKFNKTLEKFKYLFSNGYQVIYIWENDWNHKKHVLGRHFNGDTLEYELESPDFQPTCMYPFGKYNNGNPITYKDVLQGIDPNLLEYLASNTAILNQPIGISKMFNFEYEI